ncbi:MAG: MFS transporter, partial [Proteobacteria bacterium]|nr:MFS transporter [Pseudomonadota bacterium]
LFGALSDLTRSRRPWIAAGLVLSSLLLLLANRAGGVASLVGLIVCWQLALNMMLAPLAAWAGDAVADSRKGVLGGLMAFAPGLGALVATLATVPGLAMGRAREALVVAVVVALVLPALLAGEPARTEARPVATEAPTAGRHPALRMWLARLAVQIAEAALFSYLYLWFRSIDPAVTDHRTAQVLSLVLLLSAPGALLVGRWADRQGRPFAPLLALALVAALGLLAMAVAQGMAGAVAGYALFGTATSIFLALHSAQTLRVLPRSDRRGRDLGLFNLTNTIPSLVMPGLTLALVPRFGFSGLFVVFAALALVAMAILAPLARQS